jgi:hypothetical protein
LSRVHFDNGGVDTPIWARRQGNGVVATLPGSHPGPLWAEYLGGEVGLGPARTGECCDNPITLSTGPYGAVDTPLIKMNSRQPYRGVSTPLYRGAGVSLGCQICCGLSFGAGGCRHPYIGVSRVIWVVAITLGLPGMSTPPYGVVGGTGGVGVSRSQKVPWYSR